MVLLGGSITSSMWALFVMVVGHACASTDISGGELDEERSIGRSPAQVALELRDLHEVIGHLEGTVDVAISKMADNVLRIAGALEGIHLGLDHVGHDVSTLSSLMDTKLEAHELKLDKKLEQTVSAIQEKLTSLFAVRADQLTGSHVMPPPGMRHLGPLLRDPEGLCFLGHPAEVPTVCEVSPSGERWLTVFRRKDGTLDFNRGWAAYRDGFGDRRHEFWLGNQRLHEITGRLRYRLRLELLDWSGEVKVADYDYVSVGSEAEGYQLTVIGYQTNSSAGDALVDHSGMRFSTPDRDQDTHPSDCAGAKRAGWWFANCGLAYPTAQYRVTNGNGNAWYPAYKDWRSFKGTTFKIQPVHF